MESETIDLLQMMRLLKKRLWAIILLAVLGISLSGIYTFFIVDETYNADVLLYIWQERTVGEDPQMISSADLAVFSQLVSDYQVLAQSRLVTQRVADELDLDPVTASRLGNKVSVGTKSSTRHLTITVSDTDPVFASTVANKVSEVFSQVVVEKMGAGNVNIIDPAITPTRPAFPNKQLNLAIGLVLGLMLGVGLAFLIEFLDTTVKTPDDVESITGFTMLGAIPEFEHDPLLDEGRH